LLNLVSSQLDRLKQITKHELSKSAEYDSNRVINGQHTTGTLIKLNNNNYDNLYGAVTRPYCYMGVSQATK